MECKLKFEVEGCEVTIEKKGEVLHIEACKGEEVVKEMEVDLTEMEETEEVETEEEMESDDDIDIEESVKSWDDFFKKK